MDFSSNLEIICVKLKVNFFFGLIPVLRRIKYLGINKQEKYSEIHFFLRVLTTERFHCIIINIINRQLMEQFPTRPPRDQIPESSTPSTPVQTDPPVLSSPLTPDQYRYLPQPPGKYSGNNKISAVSIYSRIRLIGTGLSRQLVPINRNILVWTVYWDRLVPGSLSRLTEISCCGRYIGTGWFQAACPD